MNRFRRNSVAHTLFVIASAIVCVSGTCQADDVDKCVQSVTKQGVFKTVQSSTGGTRYSSVKSWFCSDDFLKSSQDHSIQASADTPWGAGSFNQNDSSQMEQRNKFCSSNSSDFKSGDQSALMQTEGDPVVSQMIQACLTLGNTQGSFLVAEAAPHLDGTFDINVSAKNFPSAKVLLTGTRILGGASVSDDSEFVRNAIIPVEGAGTPLSGTYKFDPADVPEARVKILTNIGSEIVSARRCPAGKVGAWQEHHVNHQSLQQLIPWSDSRPIPQASCHPHCPSGQGESLTFDFDAPDPAEAFTNVPNQPELSDPHGPTYLYQWDRVTVTQPAQNRLHVIVRTSSIGTQLVMRATLQKTTDQANPAEGDGGDIVAGQPFTVRVQDQKDAYVKFTNLNGGDLTWTANDFTSNDPPDNWVKPVSPARENNGTLLVTMKMPVPDSCQ